MKSTICLSIVLVMIAAVPAAAQEEMDHEAMMKAYMETTLPGEAHAKLAEMAGSWNYVMTTYDDPEHPMEIKGTSAMSMVMDGRYLKQETKGMMMGMPFTGIGVTGYNNITKEYESIWYDNMGTGIMKSVGTGEGNVITMHSDYIEPMTKAEMTVKTVSTIVSKNEHNFVWYNMADGKEVKAFEITYTRQK